MPGLPTMSGEPYRQSETALLKPRRVDEGFSFQPILPQPYVVSLNKRHSGNKVAAC
jgi:hypothetical protein